MPVLQALCEHTHSITTPPQNFNAIPLAPTEYEYVTAKGILQQGALNQRGQAIESTSHVSHASGKPNFCT
jgi:hypothetical protein